MVGKYFRRQYFEIFFPKNRIPEETVCMKYQILFSGKNKKSITNSLSAEFTDNMLNIVVVVLIMA